MLKSLVYRTNLKLEFAVLTQLKTMQNLYLRMKHNQSGPQQSYRAFWKTALESTLLKN